MPTTAKHADDVHICTTCVARTAGFQKYTFDGPAATAADPEIVFLGKLYLHEFVKNVFGFSMKFNY